MIAFYSYEGEFVAATKDDGSGSAEILGDIKFVVKISKGNTDWSWHTTNLAHFDDGSFRAIVLPYGVDAPPTLLEALDVQKKYGPRKFFDREDATHQKFDFKSFPGFGSVGPLVFEYNPSIFEFVLDKYRHLAPKSDLDLELDKLRIYCAHLKEHPGAWDMYAEEWREDLPLGNHVSVEFSRSEFQQWTAYFVELGQGLWVSLDRLDPHTRIPQNVVCYSANPDADDRSTAWSIADWLESRFAGYAAAFSLIRDFDDEDLGDDNHLATALSDLREEFYCGFDLTEAVKPLIVESMTQISPQFAEMAFALRFPNKAFVKRFTKAAFAGDAGLCGRSGLMSSWL